VANASRELGRFLQYAEGSALKSIAKRRVKTMVDRSSVTGNTAPVWIGLGEMVEFYDKANCNYYNMCDFQTKLDTTILPIKYNCSPTLRLRAQSLTQRNRKPVISLVVKKVTSISKFSPATYLSRKTQQTAGNGHLQQQR
jgi:microbial collagenase